MIILFYECMYKIGQEIFSQNVKLSIFFFFRIAKNQSENFNHFLFYKNKNFDEIFPILINNIFTKSRSKFAHKFEIFNQFFINKK